MMALLKGAKRKSTFLNKIQYGDLIRLNLEDQLSVFIYRNMWFECISKAYIWYLYNVYLYETHSISTADGNSFLQVLFS